MLSAEQEELLHGADAPGATKVFDISRCNLSKFSGFQSDKCISVISCSGPQNLLIEEESLHFDPLLIICPFVTWTLIHALLSIVATGGLSLSCEWWQGLAKLFKPPLEITFIGGFDAAKNTASSNNKWLVRLQCRRLCFLFAQFEFTRSTRNCASGFH